MPVSAVCEFDRLLPRFLLHIVPRATIGA